MKQCYNNKIRLAKDEEAMLKLSDLQEAVDQLEADGQIGSARQLFYWMVGNKELPNTQAEYKKILVLLTKARNAGLFSWNSIVDRTRVVRRPYFNQDEDDLIELAIESMVLNPWEDQDYYVEVMVEKQALEDVIGVACREYRVPFLACRGYLSTTSMREAGVRFMEADRRGKIPVLLYLGDHDPSGLHMDEDIKSRLKVYAEGTPIVFIRAGLTIDQVKQMNLVPNPTNENNSLAKAYAKKHDFSWELDAINPSSVISNIVRNFIKQFIDVDAWDATMQREEEQRDAFRARLTGKSPK